MKRVDVLEFAIVLADEIICGQVQSGSVERSGSFKIARLADTLMRAAKRMRRMLQQSDDGAGGMCGEARQAQWDDAWQRTQNRVHKALKPYGIGATFSHYDSCTITLQFPHTKRTNSFGNDGWCVPS